MSTSIIHSLISYVLGIVFYASVHPPPCPLVAEWGGRPGRPHDRSRSGRQGAPQQVHIYAPSDSKRSAHILTSSSDCQKEAPKYIFKVFCSILPCLFNTSILFNTIHSPIPRCLVLFSSVMSMDCLEKSSNILIPFTFPSDIICCNFLNINAEL